MLAVGARLAPMDRTVVGLDRCTAERDVLAVALYGQLLEIGGESLQVLVVGQHGDGLGAEEVIDQIARNPIRTGRFRAKDVLRKCSSMGWKPLSISWNLSGPIVIIVGSPVTDSIE